MNPITHFLISWNISALTTAGKRDRILITLGGIISDIDGLGFIFELATRHTGRPLNFYSNYHHQLAHNISAVILGLLAMLLFAKNKLLTLFIFLIVFHIHLLCDLIGARGPEGYQWPIPYLFPFSSVMQLTWKYQWELNGWQNFVITIVMLGVVFIISRRK
ncbi:MAG: metal-dependent hydrolase [Planctomycetota bacterium]